MRSDSCYGVTAMENENAIEMINITKRFPGIIANDNITLRVRKGEIHALLGENGAGKSTLMSVLFGLYNAEEGEISVNGEKVVIKNPNDATRLGIGMVHQHFKLVPVFTVLENIVLGAEETKHGFLDMDLVKKKVVDLSERYGFAIDPDAKIQDITVGQQQRVEILKMLYRENEILIFDEPTAVLTPQEIEELFVIMRELIKEGKSIIFISHKLKEIKEIADRCTVLRRGKCIGTVDVKSTSLQEMSSMMVGRNVSFTVDKNDSTPGDVILDVRNLSVRNKATKKTKVNNVSFTVRSGEIVCVAGVENNGQSELVMAITGMTEQEGGEICLNGEDVSHKTVRYRNTHGLSHVPEDRQKHGLVLDYDLAHNLIMNQYFEEPYVRNGFLNSREIYRNADELIEKYDIRSAYGGSTSERVMSGGNQQKTIIARETSRRHNLLLAVQPTRGLDVGAIEFVHKKLVEERDSGQAVLMVSFEIDEVMDVADRVLVMYEGEIVANVDPRKITVEELGLYMSGAKRGDVSNA